MTEFVEFTLHMTKGNAQNLRDTLAGFAANFPDGAERHFFESLAGEIDTALYMKTEDPAGHWFSNDELRKAWIMKEAQKRASTLEQMARLASLPAISYEDAMMTVAKASAGA